jgi:3-dehydroquinate synthetase
VLSSISITLLAEIRLKRVSASTGFWTLAAHRLEYLSDYRLRHGEAVAIGMALDRSIAGWQDIFQHTMVRAFWNC